MADHDEGGADRSNRNFLRQFRDSTSRQFRKFTATQFLEVWNHYDNDGNGFIEGSELDAFLREFVSSVNIADTGPEEVTSPDFTTLGVISETALANLKEAFMDAYDDNADEKIEISEMAQILPTDETFLVLFHKDNPLDSSVEFMRVWREFDKDSSGFIEADELKDFIKHLLKEAKQDTDVTEEKLIEYTDTMLQLFDTNKDGKLQLSEMAKLLPVKENFLCRPVFRGASRLTKRDITRVFNLYDMTASKLTRNDILRVLNLYDRDHNGTIENEELNGFLKDLMELVQQDYDTDDIDFMKHAILDQWDLDRDGKINKKELTMLLLQQSRMAADEEGLASPQESFDSD